MLVQMAKYQQLDMTGGILGEAVHKATQLLGQMKITRAAMIAKIQRLKPSGGVSREVICEVNRMPGQIARRPSCFQREFRRRTWIPELDLATAATRLTRRRLRARGRSTEPLLYRYRKTWFAAFATMCSKRMSTNVILQ